MPDTTQPPAKQRESILIFFFAVAFWFLQNFYFGWNATPQSPLEGVADFVVMALGILAVLWRPVSNDIAKFYICPQKDDA